jgi:hypothetical protein
MKIFKKVMMGMLIISSTVFTGCAKEGCVDVDSTNYDDTATSDDGSCTFEGNVVFWYNEASSTEMVGDLIEALTFYVDGKVVGSNAANVYWLSEPDCGDNASITVTQSLGNVKSESYTFSVIDNDGLTVWEGLVDFDANTCLAVELTY